jgi:hypothetical protein
LVCLVTSCYALAFDYRVIHHLAICLVIALPPVSSVSADRGRQKAKKTNAKDRTDTNFFVAPFPFSSSHFPPNSVSLFFSLSLLVFDLLPLSMSSPSFNVCSSYPLTSLSSLLALSRSFLSLLALVLHLF